MNVTLSNIETIVRNLVGDFAQTETDIFEFLSSPQVFTLSEPNVISVTVVLVNDVATTNYTFSTTTNKVTITDSLTAGDTIEIRYSVYKDFSSNRVQATVKAALVHISSNGLTDYITETVSGFSSDVIFPEPDEPEKNLISLVAGLILRPDNKSYRLPDITVNAPKDLPLHDKIRKVIGIFKGKNSHGIFDLV